MYTHHHRKHTAAGTLRAKPGAALSGMVLCMLVAGIWVITTVPVWAQPLVSEPTPAWQPEVSKWQETAQRIKQLNANSEAYKTLAGLIKTTGHRLTGSLQGKAATQYMAQAAKALGLPVHLQPFMVDAWSRKEVSLELVPRGSDNFTPIAAVSLAQTPVQSDINAQLLDLGNGLPEQFSALGTEVYGKVVLMNIGLENAAPGTKNLHRSEKVALAMKAGALGCIMINAAPGDILLTGTASADGALTSIPAVCVSQNSGKQIRAWLKEGTQLAFLKVANQLETTEVHNVIATIPGTDLAAQEIIIGGHLDSWDLANGACDNGAGTAAIFEVARMLKAMGTAPRRTIKFIWFMGEEQGLLGSKHYVASMKRAQRRNTRFMLNLDMAYASEGFQVHGRPELLPLLDSLGMAYQKTDSSFKNKNSSKAGLHSDHQPFMLRGIVSAAATSNWSAEALHCYHADCDRMQWVQPEHLDRTARLSALLVWTLATMPTLPLDNLGPWDTRYMLQQAGLKEVLQLRNEWPRW